MMQKIKDSTIGSNFVLNFQAAGQQNQDGSSNTTPNGDSEMREDNQAQVISTDANRMQQLQNDSPAYSMISAQQQNPEGAMNEEGAGQQAAVAGAGASGGGYQHNPMYQNLAAMLNINVASLPNTLSFIM